MKYSDSTNKNDKYYNFTYVQGMNVLAAPFIYTMNEVDAFFSFSKFIVDYITRYLVANNIRYVSTSIDGVFDGCYLIFECIKEVTFHTTIRLMNHIITPY